MTVSDRAHATCEACGRGYTVPNADRTYSCKQCQGTVRVPGVETGSEGHLVGALDCAECHAINHAGTTHCVECGAELLPVAEDRRALRKASNDLRRGYKWIDAFRWICRAGSVGYALVTLTAIVALGRLDVPLEEGLLVVAVSSLLTILMLMGGLQILFRPFRWTLLIACVASVAAVVHFVGPNPLGLTFAWSVFWALLFWVAISPTLRFRKLIAAHTDLYILQQASQRTRRRVESGDSGHRHERLLRVMRNASKRAWRLSAAAAVGTLLLSSAGTAIVLTQIRPADLNATIGRFEAAWSRAEPDELEGFFAAENRRWQVDRLFGFADGYHWGERFPKLSNGQRSGTGNEVHFEYQLPGVRADMRWVLRERIWWLAQISMPAPPFEPVHEQFLDAWKRTDIQRMAEFFAPEFQERMQVSLQNSLENRNWTSFPEILSEEREKLEEERVLVSLGLEHGSVLVTWWISPRGFWRLQSIEFPKAPRKIRFKRE